MSFLVCKGSPASLHSGGTLAHLAEPWLLANAAAVHKPAAAQTKRGGKG